ncbi:hypothetical protein [Capnocytophaga sp.]|uniref:hypothetical protein n=1 Tax=Capnocytophaga sp. TaxID=44737 RepID=UPI0026DB3D4A|nr:hypothetical protein [Capnocytophaga sp.]MDO5105568.1 hypothetical protein [Capnocytophaga sp.]
MKVSTQIQKEIDAVSLPDFRLGAYIYMGMGLVNGHRVCISVAYKIDYCIKKAEQFVQADPNVTFTHINKVKVGELEACQRFLVETD